MRTARHRTAFLSSCTVTSLASRRLHSTQSTPPPRRSSTFRVAGSQVRRAPDGGTLGWCAPVGPSAIGGLSALQSTDAGKAYHCGIVMLLKLLGQPVPGVPTNTREAKAVLVFVEDLLRTMWRQPDWFVPSPVPPPSSDRAVPAYLPRAPVQVGDVSLRAAVLQRDARRGRAAGRVAQRSWSRPVPSPRRAKDQPRLSATDASPAASPGAPCTPAPLPVRVRIALTARPPV